MMRTKHWITLSLLGAVSAAPLLAQEPDAPQPDRRRVRVMVDGQDLTKRLMPLMERRARLGVLVSLDAKETDSLGAFIQSVTPGGPAAKAGLRSGDIIAKLNGTSVLTAPGRNVEKSESTPGVRLIELAAKLEPNQEVSVEYYRGDARRTTRLTTGDEPIMALEGNVFAFRSPEGQVREYVSPRIEVRRIPESERVTVAPRWNVETNPRFNVMFGGSLDLELAPLNADLGWYFGTTEGVLVVRTPKASALGLKPGDVVLSVDGRTPSSPSNLLRILRSYDSDEEISIEVMRQKRKQTITGKLDRGGDWEFDWQQNDLHERDLHRNN